MAPTYGYLINAFSYFQPKDVVDILIISIITYTVIIFIKQTRLWVLFYSTALFVVLYYLSNWLDLGLTRQIIQPVVTFFFVIFVVIFQKEIRRFFVWLSATGHKLAIQNKVAAASVGVADSIAEAVMIMAKQKTGALIVLAGDYPLEGVVQGGYFLGGRISVPLLLSIFDSSSPGHDGAVIIDNNRIERFAVHLPLADNLSKVAKFGTRHRAALGLSEKTDALTIVVSEERGTVSVTEGGEIEVITDKNELENRIRTFLKENIAEEINTGVWSTLVTHNFGFKILSLLAALAFWFFFVVQVGVVNQSFDVPIEFRLLPKNYLVDQVVPKTIHVSLSGKYKDLQNLNKNDLKVYYNASELNENVETINLTEKNFELPPYLSVTSFSPSIVKVKIKKNTN
jgi:uncharacterized protein (TIGR00159 family)